MKLQIISSLPSLIKTNASNFLLLAFGMSAFTATNAQCAQTKFEPIPTQFIAAPVDPKSRSGIGAQNWGLWEKDPGPRGVWLKYYSVLIAAGGYAPSLWKFDPKDWWLDENGLIMEKPKFNLRPGQYQVTGNRETTAILTIHPADKNGQRKWDLSDGATINDVTHLRCRSSRFTPTTKTSLCSPANAPKPAFPISIGTKMPNVTGCDKQDYQVLFIVGKAITENGG